MTTTTTLRPIVRASCNGWMGHLLKDKNGLTYFKTATGVAFRPNKKDRILCFDRGTCNGVLGEFTCFGDWMQFKSDTGEVHTVILEDDPEKGLKKDHVVFLPE